MNEAPWVQPKTRRIVNIILNSYQKAFQNQLIKCQPVQDSNRLKSQELFTIKMPVLAHDNQKDPCLIYANSEALRIWGRRWEQMIGMPSRLTAPVEEQINRSVTLSKAVNQKPISRYCGIRINKKGQKFQINNAQIWTLYDEKDIVFGQAASFASFWII